MQGTSLISTSLSLPQGMGGSFYQQTGSTVAQSLSTQPLEQLAYNDEFYPSTAGIDEQYIYVTYPSAELKKRLSDRYGDRETLLVLTNDEHF